MLWSRALIPTLKETPQEAESISHQLMLRAGMIRMLMAGVYSYLPLGLRVLNNIQDIIRQEMDACGASELLLPALQPQELWIRSGRDKDMGQVMIRFTDRRGRNSCLGPTHEEVITDLVKNHISSYRQLPLILYQIQTKFRDEIRPRFGVVRANEFIMKDAYSFDKDEAGIDKNYKLMHKAYNRIFKRCGLKILTVEAEPGVMGGNMSHEFMVPADIGEDLVWICPRCKSARPAIGEKQGICSQCEVQLETINSIEVGHIFKLGTKYSSVLGANFLDGQGKLKPIIMGCYGIGVSRLMAAIIEQNHDREGIIWPGQISPYQVIILALDVTDRRIMKEASEVYRELGRGGIEALFDDRDERAGVKFKDADLLGINLQIIIGKESLKKNSIELKLRLNHKKISGSKQAVLRQVKKIAQCNRVS
ncbi:MAG: proline--tRNA ligase [Candidatus Omnitrophica bacterium]|nr:proline--tRNA ligase [Candidatus Omnitrophota bacterium]MCG2706016.1 proline--tRNA ligase [Candidatus Omnitrophota bacterium]